MGYNKNLTDDQLKAMFTATGEEMMHIEKPMECLTESTKHKCKRCSRFLSNKAALKQHHCKSQIKMGQGPHCSKTINRINNLEKDLRNCEKAPIHPRNWQLRQTTLDGFTSLENGLSAAKKLMVEEMQVGGLAAEHTEHWKALEIEEFTLKFMALTFRKALNSNNKKDGLRRLKEVIHSMRLVIEGQTRVNVEAVKR